MKYFIILLLSFSILDSLAQIDKGDKFIGLQGGGYLNDSFIDKVNYKKDWSYNSTLSFGKVTSNNVVVGFQLTYGHSYYFNWWEYYFYKRSELSAGYFRRYYKPISKRLYIWGQAGVNYTYNTQTSLGGRSWGKGMPFDYWGHTLNVVVYPGLSYSINKSIQIEASYRDLLNLYASKRTEYIAVIVNSPRIKNTALGFAANKNLNLAWQLGVRLFITKKK